MAGGSRQNHLRKAAGITIPEISGGGTVTIIIYPLQAISKQQIFHIKMG